MFMISAVVVGGSSSTVSAELCGATLSYSLTTMIDNSNKGMLIPVLAGCSFNNGELYAVGEGLDTSRNLDLGTASTILTNNVANSYSGQLIFTLPQSVSGYSIQVSISINGGAWFQYAPLLTTSAETMQIDPGNYYQIDGCSLYGCSYNSCQLAASDNGTTQCAGFLFEDPNGCVGIVIPVYSPSGLLSYQYYTLHNLPSTYPPIGSWVSVTGQLYQGYNVGPNGEACPGNYINVTSITESSPGV